MEVSLSTPLVNRDSEYQIDVIEFQFGETGVRMSLAQTVARGAAVHANVSDGDSFPDESLADNLHDGRGGNLQHGEIAPRVFGGKFHGFREHTAESLDLIVRQRMAMLRLSGCAWSDSH